MDLWVQSLSVAKTVLLSDWPTEQVDALFFHSQSFGNDDGLFEIAADFYARRAAVAVVINGSRGEDRVSKTPGKAWEGADIWVSKLETHGVGYVFRSRPAFDTKGENEEFLEVALAIGWRSAVILTQPHHVLRAFLGMVKSMADLGYWMRVYAVAPRSTNWCKGVYGSQGVKSLLRIDHIEEEDKRVQRYQQEGRYGKDGRDLATFGELFEYLKRRESLRR